MSVHVNLGERVRPSKPLKFVFLHKSKWVLCTVVLCTWYHFFSSFFFSHFYFPASGQAAFTGVVPSPPQFLQSLSIAHWVQQSHCSSIFHRVWLRSLFMVPRSRSQMFLTFVSKSKDQDADVAFPNSVYGKNESRCRSYKQQQC